MKRKLNSEETRPGKRVKAGINIADRVLILNDGISIPQVGFGTFQMTQSVCKAAIPKALEVGYRHIDTAEKYRNEKAIGEVMNKSGIPREEMFITTKLWPGMPKWNQPEKTADTTRTFMSTSLKKLGVDYVDMVLIHAPFAKKERLNQYRTLLDLKKEGKCRSVGVSNYGIKHIEEIAEAGLPIPSVNQIEVHPFNLNKEIVEYCQKKGIAIIAYGSLAPLNNWRDGCKYNSKPEDAKLEGQFKEIASKHGKTVAQVLLCWAIQKGFAIIPKSATHSRIEQNFYLDFTIEEADMKLMDSLDRKMFCCWNKSFDPSSVA